MSHSTVGRADLARALAGCGPEEEDRVADMLGFHRLTDVADPLLRPPEPPRLPPPLPLPEPGRIEIQTAPLRPVPFWHAARFAPRAGQEDRREAVPSAAPRWKNAPDEPPVFHPLAPWRQLLPRLRALIGDDRPTDEVDTVATVEELCRGHQLERLPREKRRRWAGHLQVIVDRSDRLVPFWDDQDLVITALRALQGSHRFELALVHEGLMEPRLQEKAPSDRIYRPPPPGSAVLVLGDLGSLEPAGGGSRDAWRRLGCRLKAAGCRPAALLPAPLARCPSELRALWRVIPWERGTGSLPQDGASLRLRADRLLSLVSPAIRIEPGFLRAVRISLKSGAADAGTEADVWQHAAIASRSPVAASMHATAAEPFRAAFAAESPDLQRHVLALLRAWRWGLPDEIWLEEVASLAPSSRALLPHTEDVATARRLFTYLHHIPGGRSEGGRAVAEWLGRVGGRATGHGWQVAELAQAVYVVKCRDPRFVPPAGVDPAKIGQTGPAYLLEVLQRGNDLVVANPGDAVASSPLGLLRTGNGLIRVLQEPAAQPDATLFWAEGLAPAWARSWGRDDYGPWVSFAVTGADDAEVIQRMRWCPPGSFAMGSPDEEEGRWGDEGPRHDVTFAHGFWMFETAVTRAMWQAVTGALPDGEDPAEVDLPVTHVSWADARRFIDALNARLPGLDLVLPSEAQWEYACRARTSTPYHFGWEADRARINYNARGPVPVASLPPNAWGLHEMHGNVDEWCADHWHDSYNGAPTDGSAWLKEHPDDPAGRVVRGGSWYDFARYVRAAYRNGNEPSNRDDTLGFRCARVQGVSSSGQEAVPADPAGGRGAERRPSQGPPGAAQALRLEPYQAPVATRLPAVGRLVVETDRDRLELDQMPKPSWASGIGRDRSGLFADLAVPSQEGTEVIQRLRWIPPGRFLMGSPEDEEGRDKDEGPRHEVVIGSGFWLFDTPCMQALWEAVMGPGSNPSRFRSPTRPVEQVSFADVQDFLARLNGRVVGLDLVLPSEAQWEHACRAGTSTATYAGEMKLLGEHDAPVLDAIAWYGGNSGVGYELDEGQDSSDWPDKQHPHTWTGTRPVGLKRPNGWGLHDMLGNVFEWCVDHWHDSYEGAPADGSAWVEDDPAGAAERVVRGGSWLSFARLVRAAYRGRNEPSIRGDFLGFRCARVQGVSRVAVAWRAGGGGPAQRSEQAADTGTPRERGGSRRRARR